MPRLFLGLITALFAGISVSGTVAAGDSGSIRIEPRAFYGATISLEAGVRVFRSLPRTTHVIVNPNRTPVKLTFKEITNNNFEAADVVENDDARRGGVRFGGRLAHGPRFHRRRAPGLGRHGRRRHRLGLK